MSRQLALPFTFRPGLTHATFVPGDANADACRWLANPRAWPQLRLAVHGAAGVGKTHLLHAFAERQGGVLIPGEAVRYLVDLPGEGAIAVDDADAAPEPEALLHLLNAAAEARLPILLAGRLPPAQWNVALPDLASRLRATHAVALGQPDDELLEALFARLLAERQLRVEAPVQAWLLARLPRQGGALREAALRLDRASLADGRRVSRATAAHVLAGMGAYEEDVTQDGSRDAVTLL
jgi:chromosomal replication initiation ATPase DnaA